MTQPERREVLHKDGSVRGRGQMLDDEMHGYWEWFRLDGTIMRSGSFDRGRQIGTWTTYDRAGAPHKQTQFGA
jgi:antitoxin component YwqK of YwqJK toxin-antitoxin module